MSLSVILPSIKREIVTSLHAGRIKEFIENWALITQDPWVLQTVQGFQLPLVGQPTQATAPPQLQLSLEQQDLVSTEVQAMIEKRAISGVQPDQRGFVSQIFLVPKKDGGHRPVVNLKALNKFIVEEHFKMEGFHMVEDLVKPGDWLAKLDLKDAYFLVPVDPNHQKFLQFQWQGNLYQFHCLPFGLSCAPRTFTKLMKPVVAFLRERGIRLIIYLDDLLILCNCRDTLLSQLELIKDLFQTLGLLINNKKSQLEPSQEIVFLGLTISTIAMQVSLPKEKVTRIQQEARQMLSKTEVSVQKLAAFVGMTTAAKQAVRVAPLFHRHLQALINRVVPLASSLEEVRQSYHQIVEISREASQELGWWMQEMQNYNKAPLLADPPDLVIESDASRLGWGATLKGQELRTGGQWSTSEQEMHINCLELLAASLAIQTFAKERQNINILVRTDNVSTRAYINHFGGTHPWPMNHLAIQVWKWCIDRKIFLTAEHLPGIMNQVADKESRTVRDRCDWMIHPHLFAQIERKMGPLEVDMFASRLTHQLPRYFSWRPDPAAEAIDAFSQVWSQLQGYANPPWCLLLPTLAKIQRERARVVLVAPMWKTQPWYPLLLQLLRGTPLLIPIQENVVISPTQEGFIMPSGVPQLAVWPLSGIKADQEGFQKELRDYWNPHGGIRPSQHTSLSSNAGIVGVWNGIEIPLGVLLVMPRYKNFYITISSIKYHDYHDSDDTITFNFISTFVSDI